FDSCSRWGWLDLSAQRKQTEKLVNALKIRAQGVQQVAGSLSGGNQQKVVLARLLHQDARVLLLDEPTRGLDIATQREVAAILRELAAEGRAILMTSSSTEELLASCDTIGVMRRGRLVDARAASQWSRNQLLEVASASEPAS